MVIALDTVECKCSHEEEQSGVNMTYMYQVVNVFVQWAHGMKSFCVAIVYLQTMKGFHVDAVALIAAVIAEFSTGSAGSGLLKK